MSMNNLRYAIWDLEAACAALKDRAPSTSPFNTFASIEVEHRNHTSGRQIVIFKVYSHWNGYYTSIIAAEPEQRDSAVRRLEQVCNNEPLWRRWHLGEANELITY